MGTTQLNKTLFPTLGFDMVARFPAWTAHARAMAERPAVKAVFAREGLPLPA